MDTEKLSTRLRELACDANRQSQYDVDRGVTYFKREIHKYNGEYKAVVEMLLDEAIRMRLHAARHIEAEDVKRSAAADEPPTLQIKQERPRNPKDADAALNCSSAYVLEVSFGRGKPFGNWDRGDCLSQAEAEERKARGHLRMAEFFRKVGKKVNGNKTVRQCIKPAEAAELLRKAMRAEAA